MTIHGIHGIPTRKGTAITRQLPSAPSFELGGTPGDDGVARQRALVGDSLNDEQRGDGLSNPASN